MNRSERGGLAYLHLARWDATRVLTHGFLTRQRGVSPSPYATLNLGVFSGDTLRHVRENLQRLAQALDIPAARIVGAKQIHGSAIHRVTAGDERLSVFSSEKPLEGDGLATNEPGLFLAVLTADCLPILLFDPVCSAVAAVHAGWRGTLERISERAVSALRDWYGSRPEDIQAAFGPAIGACCYGVGEDVVSLFREADPGSGPWIRGDGPGRWTLDLAALNRQQCLEAGLRPDHLFFSGICTRCFSDQFFSVRAQGKTTGRMISLIGLRSRDRTAKTEPPGKAREKHGGKLEKGGPAR